MKTRPKVFPLCFYGKEAVLGAFPTVFAARTGPWSHCRSDDGENSVPRAFPAVFTARTGSWSHPRPGSEQLSCALVDPSTFPPPNLGDLVSRRAGRGRLGRRDRPFRFLLDSRVFRVLCEPAALDSFRAGLACWRLAPEGGLPNLELTPLAVLDVIGVEPPQFPSLPYLPDSMATLEDVEVGIVIKGSIQKEFEKVPELDPESLKKRVDELRQTTDPAAHELFDLCLTRFVSRDKFEEEILEQLIFDALFTFRFPEEYRARMAQLFNSFLLNSKTQVSGLTKVRRLKTFWDRSLERLLRKHPRTRGEVLAVDQEMRPRTYKDFLGWEMVHHSVLGIARTLVHPVIAFTPEPEDRLRARCRAHKTALRAFLDEIPQEELAGELRPWIRAWTPGWLVTCREDGTLEAAVSTGEVPIL